MKHFQDLKKHVCTYMYTTKVSIVQSMFGWAVYGRQGHVEVGSGRQSVMVVYM